MQQQDIINLLQELSSSLGQPDANSNITALQSRVAPILLNDLQVNAIKPVSSASRVTKAVQPGRKQVSIISAFPASNRLLSDSPGVFKTLGKKPVATARMQALEGNIGSGILNHLPLKIPVKTPGRVKIPVRNITETISIFLDTDTTHPVIIVPVTIGLLKIDLPNQVSKYTVAAGSIWILSKLISNAAPAGTYTGLTISGGTITFNQHLVINNKAIIMPAGAVCTVSLNLKQPVNNTVSPDNIGIDAMNAKIVLPATFNFTLTKSGIKINSFTDASWNLYGSANTFQYDPAQSPVYNPVLNGIYIGCKVIAPTFAISKCDSSFFTIRGSAPILDGYWDLPVATIDITQPNTALGTGALAAICLPGLQVNWTGLKGGWVNLSAPLLSATVGIIGVTDLFAGNRYGTQHYDLWSNETTGRLSTADISYSKQFGIYFLSIQNGEELLSTNVSFIANIDRPVRVDDSPVSVKGSNALLYQAMIPGKKIVFLYDSQLLLQNYPPKPNTPLTEVPQQALALTNGLLTTTPVSGVILFGELANPTTFVQARLILSFGLFNLTPALPDPYAASRLYWGSRRGNTNIAATGAAGNDQVQKTLPLSLVQSLLTCLVSWPQPGTPANAPQAAKVSFAITPLANTSIGASNVANQQVFSARAAATDQDAGKRWDQVTAQFGAPNFSMLDVSTNADLMGVSFSTTNIQAKSAEQSSVIQPVDNSAEADMLQILGMDLATPGKFIRAFTVPEITWEPVVNLTAPAVKPGPQDPPLGWLLFGDDGGPTQIFNNSSKVVPIAPLLVSKFIVDSYTNNPLGNPLITASLFTLPFGMRSMAIMNSGAAIPKGHKPPTLSIEPQDFDITPKNVPNATQKIMSGGLQISARGQQDTTQPNVSPSFSGFTTQSRNALDSNGAPVNASVLGPGVDYIFNQQFQPPVIHKVGVPVERIDFSGYGASMFSNWLDPNASIAATSQAKFDVVVGRTSLEIIQVKSLVYPWGIRVVRTVTIYRSGSAIIYRVDSGWRADTDGVYDFSYNDESGTHIKSPYIFHPGIVKGVFNVKNIVENDLPQFSTQWFRTPPGNYINDDGNSVPIPPAGVSKDIQLQPIYFDADVLIDNVVQGASKGKVPSKQMLGYVQLGPRGEPISPAFFNQLLQTQAGSLGGPVDCIVDIGGSGQQMRLNRVDVASAPDPALPDPVFTGTARGTVILPKDGSWSIVQHDLGNGAVSAVDNNASVPLIRKGKLLVNGKSDYPAEQLRLANPADLLRNPGSTTVNYGLLQNTGTQKVLFQLPAYKAGIKQLQSKGKDFPLAKFADAFHLINSTGIFPNPLDIPDMDMSKFGIDIVDKGYKLLNKLSPGNILKQVLPSPWYFVNTKDIKLYITYNAGADDNLNYDLNSVAESWVSSAKSMTLNVDLGPFTKMVYIDGNFDSENGSDSAFNLPQLQFGPDLKPIVDILQVLESLSTGDYAAVAKKALQVAMSNGGDNFEYKFHADKEIATLHFPPAELDGPTTPLRLTAGLKVGAYFNEALSITSDPSNLIPSAGAYFEFDGGMQVMCVSLAAATVYAVGQVVVRISADVKTGPALYMKFGFGIELMVGLPVVGNVSVTYMVGIEMNLTSVEIKIAAFLLFKGEASLIGGLVDITITIEASGTIDRKADSTDMTAQVTFAIDICIFLVIDINFSKSWSESRQIA